MSTTDDTDDTASGTYPGCYQVSHPVSVFAERLNSRLDDLATTPLLSMTAPQKRRGLLAIGRAEAKLAALRLRLLADAETTGACTETGAATAAAWVAVATRQTPTNSPIRPHPGTVPGASPGARRGDGRRPRVHRPGPGHHRGARHAAKDR